MDKNTLEKTGSEAHTFFLNLRGDALTEWPREYTPEEYWDARVGHYYQVFNDFGIKDLRLALIKFATKHHMVLRSSDLEEFETFEQIIGHEVVQQIIDMEVHEYIAQQEKELKLLGSSLTPEEIKDFEATLYQLGMLHTSLKIRQISIVSSTLEREGSVKTHSIKITLDLFPCPEVFPKIDQILSPHNDSGHVSDYFLDRSPLHLNILIEKTVDDLTVQARQYAQYLPSEGTSDALRQELTSLNSITQDSTTYDYYDVSPLLKVLGKIFSRVYLV